MLAFTICAESDSDSESPLDSEEQVASRVTYRDGWSESESRHVTNRSSHGRLLVEVFFEKNGRCQMPRRCIIFYWRICHGGLRDQP